MPHSSTQPRAKILYIDDDPINRNLVNRVLGQHDFKVIEAETGLEGIRIATQEAPDLILMDINMPGLDGHETTTRMRSITAFQSTPIIALTAHRSEGDRELALIAGCNGYIHKPIDIQKFPLQIIGYLDGQTDTISQDEQRHHLGRYSRKLVERLEAKILELEEANVRLQKVDKLKSDFITVAGHELRTPLTLVYGYSRLLQSAVGEIDVKESTAEQMVNLVNKIHHSVHRLSEVVNDILNVFHIEANEMYLKHDLVNLKRVVQAALNELNPAKHRRTLQVTVDLDDLPEITGDSDRLRQVFWNLLSNAIKFTPDHGSILIKGWTPNPDEATGDTLMANPEGRQVVVMVKDTGIGISPDNQKDIFERFYMVEDPAYHSSSKTAFGGGGIGLGLSIAKGIVEAHGGRIWVESPGQDAKRLPGSTFYVILPINIHAEYGQ